MMKIISVPTSLDAMSRLDFDKCIEGDLEEIELSDDSFNLLWDFGLFNSLNSRLNIMIDEFEDEIIPIELIGNAIRCIDSFESNNKEINVLLKKIKNIFIFAKNKGTGVFFYF